jgi:NAD(P)-dependent dehydrogenase (short-subunit alcohol dehydrogenase family)
MPLSDTLFPEHRDSRRLLNQTTLVVGGTSGIGLASARRFLQEGARVVIAGRDPDSGRLALEKLDAPDRVFYVPADVRDPSSVTALFEQTVEHLGPRLDILFHVAGISGRRYGDAELHECSDAGWDVVFDINARGMFLTNRSAVRRMMQQPLDEFGLRGTVLNMGSVLGWSPAPRYFGTIAYAASKGAIRAMTLAAAARYAPDRIRFNLIAPALIATPMAVRAAGDAEILAYLSTKQPIAGGPGSADDCAEAALFLCEPAARFITGTVLTVDGGWCVSEGQFPRPENPEHAPAD